MQGVFEVDFEKGLTLTEIGEGVSVEDIKAATKCNFKVCVDNIRRYCSVTKEGQWVMHPTLGLDGGEGGGLC